jgi:hypothetical protein
MRSVFTLAVCLMLPLGSLVADGGILEARSADDSVRLRWKPDAATWLELDDNKGMAVLRPAPAEADKKALPLNMATGEFSVTDSGTRREESVISVSGAGRIGLQIASAVFLSSSNDEDVAVAVPVAKRVLIPGKTNSFPVNLMVPKGRFDRGSITWSVETSFQKAPVELRLPYMVVPTAESTKPVDMLAIRSRPFSFTRHVDDEFLFFSPSAVAGPWLGFGGLQMGRLQEDAALPASPDGFWVFASKSEREVPIMTQVAGLPAGAMIRVVLLTKIHVRAELADMRGNRMPLAEVTGEQLQSWTERWFVVPPDPLFPETRARAIWLWFDGLPAEPKTGLIEIRVPKK